MKDLRPVTLWVWKSVRMSFWFQGHLLRLLITPKGTHLERLSGAGGLKVSIAGEEVVV